MVKPAIKKGNQRKMTGTVGVLSLKSTKQRIKDFFFCYRKLTSLEYVFYGFISQKIN